MGEGSTGDELASEQHMQRISEASRAGMDTRGLFELISTQFELEAAEGNFTPERQAMLSAMLEQLERCIESQPDDDLARMIDSVARLKAMMPMVAEARLTPSRRATTPLVAAGSYQETLMTKYKSVFSWLGQQAVGMNRGEQTNDALNDLYILRSGEIKQAILGATEDCAARGVEREVVRRFALEVKDTALAEHLTICDPIWPTPSVSRNTNGIFYSGFDDTMGLLQQAVDTLNVGLVVMPQTTQGNPSSHRWNQMRAAALCVFDMTRYSGDTSGTNEHLKKLATVGYELGIALSLGRPIIVLADPSRPLPFDVDITPVLLNGNDSDTATLMTALDDVIYKVQRTGGENSLHETRAQATALFSDHANADVRLITRHAFEEGRPDARRVRNVLDSIAEIIGQDAPCFLTPVWAGSYPSTEQQRCFHVTAFGPDWADAVRELVQSSCQSSQQAIDYIRGDSVLDADIIRSIWNEICRATHVVVDVTGLNINALMELGMAHTLGRNVLLITQDDDFSTYPTSLSKQRFHHYSLTPDGKSKLGNTLNRFFNENTDSVSDDELHVFEQQSRTLSMTLSCPEALSIRAHIDQVLQQDDSSVIGPLQEHAASLGMNMDATNIDGVRSYIDFVPALVEGLYRVAYAHDQMSIVQPILSTMEGYFTRSNDLIADHYGLIGLLDDAYLAYTFIDRLNNEFVEKQGTPLLTIDIAAMNQYMRPLLTDAIAVMIEQHVQSTIEQNRLVQQLKNAGKWLLGGIAAVVAWNVVGGMSSSTQSNSDRKYALMDAQIYQ